VAIGCIGGTAALVPSRQTAFITTNGEAIGDNPGSSFRCHKPAIFWLPGRL
jgi:hypothetical protein